MRRLLPLAFLLSPAVALAGFEASSFKQESRHGANHWSAASALDEDLSTAWMVDPEQSNVGSWFEIGLPRSTVTGVGVVIGWDESAKTFRDHARVKAMKVEVFDASDGGAPKRVLEHELTFEDQRGWQVVDLPDTEIGDHIFGGRVRLTITEVYPGRDYPNLAVPGLRVHLAEQEAPVALVSPPEGALEGHPAEHRVDGDGRTFWASAGPGEGETFAVGADGWALSHLGIQPGPQSHARPKTIEIVASHATRTYEVADRAELQWFMVPPIVGYLGSNWGPVEVRIVDTWPGPRPEVALSEVKLRATSHSGL